MKTRWNRTDRYLGGGLKPRKQRQDIYGVKVLVQKTNSINTTFNMGSLSFAKPMWMVAENYSKGLTTISVLSWSWMEHWKYKSHLICLNHSLWLSGRTGGNPHERNPYRLSCLGFLNQRSPWIEVVSPRTWSKGSIKAKSFLGSLPWPPDSVDQSPKVTSDSDIRGNCAGSEGSDEIWQQPGHLHGLGNILANGQGGGHIRNTAPSWGVSLVIWLLDLLSHVSAVHCI